VQSYWEKKFHERRLDEAAQGAIRLRKTVASSQTGVVKKKVGS
jgi:hypothetical protein